jgi:hypothetical protein
METDRVRDPSQVQYGELPELTRTLRALGSSRRGGSAASLQASFFLPLIEARRRAAEARSAITCLRAFDAAPLARALEQAIDRIVADWPDARDSARRALRAELVERVSDYLAALTVLTERAHVVLAADESARLQAWRGWTVQLAVTFEAADRSWMALRSVVEALPSRSKP